MTDWIKLHENADADAGIRTAFCDIGLSQGDAGSELIIALDPERLFTDANGLYDISTVESRQAVFTDLVAEMMRVGFIRAINGSVSRPNEGLNLVYHPVEGFGLQRGDLRVYYDPGNLHSNAALKTPHP